MAIGQHCTEPTSAPPSRATNDSAGNRRHAVAQPIGSALAARRAEAGIEQQVDFGQVSGLRSNNLDQIWGSFRWQNDDMAITRPLKGAGVSLVGSSEVASSWWRRG